MKFPPKMPVLLVDTHNLAVTSFYQAQRTDRNFKSYTNESAKEVLHGVLNTILSATKAKALGPCIVAGAWDSDVNWRHEVDPEYKGGKSSPMRPDTRLGAQMQRLNGQLEQFGILNERFTGLEADDTIALMATHPDFKDRPKVLLTRDKDALAFVTEDVFYYNPQFKKLVTPKTFEQYTAKVFKLETGIKPNELPLFRAMSGDTSDEIPGVTGFGDASALSVVLALRPTGLLKGNNQTSDELAAIITDNVELLPPTLQKLTDPEPMAQLKHYFDLVNISNIPDNYRQPVYETAEPRFPERPTKEQLLEAFDAYGFKNFRKLCEEYGWGLGTTQPDIIAPDVSDVGIDR
jgi:5'-3' exonuclease